MTSNLDKSRGCRKETARCTDAVCFSYVRWLFDCYLFQLTKGPGRYNTGML